MRDTYDHRVIHRGSESYNWQNDLAGWIQRRTGIKPNKSYRLGGTQQKRASTTPMRLSHRSPSPLPKTSTPEQVMKYRKVNNSTLEQLAHAYQYNAVELKKILDELSFRSTRASKSLETRIKMRLANL